MKPKKLYHPQVFNDKDWAERYYIKNKKKIEKTGQRFVKLLIKSDFNGKKVFDAGCGFGSIAIEIAKAYPKTEIIGIDLAEPLIKIGQSLIIKEGLEKQITLKKGDVQKIDSPDNTFDLVINSYLLHIVENPVKMLNEIERITKPDGIIMITDLRKCWLKYLMKKFNVSYTIQEAEKIIAQSNIRQSKVTKGFFWWDYMTNFRQID
ncbi:MAG: class I SAM-dependent methyltransferase [Bacteroidales bacterium]|nr:class I SAM-dependent methyltransferase [Bacteroidales bacterium]